MTPRLATILTWACWLTLGLSAISALSATPLGGGGWNSARLLSVGFGATLALLLFAAREILTALSGLPRMQSHLDFIAHRVEAVRLGQAVHVGDDTALTLLEPAHPIYVDTRCRHIGPHIITTGTWEPQYTALFRRMVRPGDSVLDLGANHGVYAILAAAAAGPTGQVHAFEANPHLAALIQRSVAANGYDARVTVHGCAVGDRAGEVLLDFIASGSGGGMVRDATSLLPADWQRLHVPMVALDAVFPAPEFTVHAIKMDIEGGEGRALRGMRGLLERSPAVRILMEYAPDLLRAAGTDPAAMIDDLAVLGMRFWTIGEDGAIAPITAHDLGHSTVAVRNILVSRLDPP